MQNMSRSESSAALRLPRKTIACVSVALFSLAALAGTASATIHTIAVHLALIFLIVVSLRQLILLCFAVLDRPRARHCPIDEPPVSVIVPAYTEAEVIEAALESLCAIDYPNLEIIVVDDGSADDTYTRARVLARQRPERQIRTYCQVNAGKASALNLGIEHARGKYLLCVDADSRVQPDVIRRGLPHLADPTVAAVGGAVEVANANSLLTLFQQLEYTLCLNFLRRALSCFGAVTVVPGPIGLFRREALLSVGGYDERRDLYAEDAELTVRLLSRGWKVIGDTSMIARTQAPQDVFSLLRQRYRWKRGLFQAFDANLLSLLLLPGMRGIGLTIFLIVECFLLDVLNLTVLVFVLSHVLVHWELQPLVGGYAVIVGMELAALLVAYDVRGFSRNLVLLVLQRISYASLLQAWGVLALMDEWRSTRMDWDKLERVRYVERAS